MSFLFMKKSIESNVQSNVKSNVQGFLVEGGRHQLKKISCLSYNSKKDKPDCFCDDDAEVTDKWEMSEMVINYFDKVFARPTQRHQQYVSTGASLITERQNRKLIDDIIFAEFTCAIKEMHPHKASEGIRA